MTVTSIPVTDLPTVDKTRRDQWGRYKVLPPGGDKPVGYTRVTTVAKALDDSAGLPPWEATMAITGMIMRRGLYAQWEALMAEYNGNPWYADEESKKACKKLVKECSAVGGANDRSEIGTALHKIIAFLHRGGPAPSYLSDETLKDLDAINTTLDEAGVQILPHQVELTVVLDEHRVAGTFDCLALVPGFDKPLIADLKTGSSLDYSWQYIAVQLAAYSRGDAIYVQGPAEDGSGDQRVPMPAVDQDNGLIIWCNAGTGECKLFLVDLEAGWEGFGHSMWAREWQKRELDMPLVGGGFKHAPADLAATLEQSLAAVEQIDVDHVLPTEDAPSREAGGADGVVHPDTRIVTSSVGVDDIRAWLQGRITAIGKDPAAREDLGRSWPADLPTLNSSSDHSPTQLAAIERLCWDVERRRKLPLPPPKPGELETEIEMVLATFPNSTVITSNSEQEHTP